MSEAIALLVNPAAGQGRARARGAQVHRALQRLGPVELHETRAPGDEIMLAMKAARDGARLLAIVGGDGSVSQAVRGLLRVQATIPVAVFAAGSGNDLVKSLPAPSHDVAAMVRCIAAGHTMSVDAGLIDDIPFVNAAGFGFDVEVLRRTALLPSPKRSGHGAYLATAVRSLFSFPCFTATVGDTRGKTIGEGAQLMLIFANGRCFGGAFRIAPDALLDDGALDAVLVGNLPSIRERLAVLGRALRGRHVTSAGVRMARGSAYRVAFDLPPMFEADGELHQARERVVHIGVLPNAARFIVERAQFRGVLI